MASSTKTVQSSPAPISQPQPTPPAPSGPLVVQAIQHIEEMDQGQLARSAGQILYDLAIQDPTINVASPEILGMLLQETILTPTTKKFDMAWLPLLERYIKHSMVAKDPRLVAMAFTRIVTIQLYAAGKLDNANQANPDRA